MLEDEKDYLLTRQEVEARFGISKRFLELAPAMNKGPKAVRIGRSVRYRVGDIRDWIKCHVDGGS